MNPRGVLTALYEAALAAVEPESLVRAFLAARPEELRGVRRVGLFAAGKAALSMARGVPARLAPERLVIVPRDSTPGRPPEPVLRASHPLPDASSLAAGRAALRFFTGFGQGDVILALISGGASSLLCLPRPGLALAEKRRRVEAAMRRGWPIARLNALRTSLSRIKGGRLAEATQARVVTLVLSDVPGGDLSLVGSGPTVSRRRRGDRAVLLADNAAGLDAAESRARGLGLEVRRRRRRLAGEAGPEGRRLARALARCVPREGEASRVWLAGGETTVTLTRRAGRGGRCQELALAAAEALEGRRGLFFLAAGSDGRDGDSDNAGAFADGTTISRARARGLDAAGLLGRHASAELFEALGDELRTGPTGTNVADWVFGLALPLRSLRPSG